MTEVRARLLRAIHHHASVATAVPPLRKTLAAALDSRGRMFRGRLTLMMGNALGLDPEKCDRLACAVEFWHHASLILDDFPMMDDATERRGVPCLHHSHGEANALLAALALIHRGYVLSFEAFSSGSGSERASSIAFLDRTLGHAGIIGGQAFDVGYSAANAKGEVSRIARLKTACLLELCLCLPALQSRLDGKGLLDLRRLAIYWGLAYQAIDDLADHAFDRAAPDASERSEANAARPSLVHELGEKSTERRVLRLIDLARRAIARLCLKDPALSFLFAFHAELESPLAAKSEACA